MVQALITLNEHTNKILNIVKAEFGLNDKSEAIKLVTKHYEEELMEPELRPEFIAEMQKVAKEKPIHIGNLENLRKRYGLT